MGQAATGGACSRGRVERATTRSTIIPNQHATGAARPDRDSPASKSLSDRCHDRCPCSALVLVAVWGLQVSRLVRQSTHHFQRRERARLAQSKLGWMYDAGHGVPQNYEEAFKWYSKPPSKGTLGRRTIWASSTTTAKRFNETSWRLTSWYCLSAAQGNTNAINNRNSLLSSLTPQQVAEGQRRARVRDRTLSRHLRLSLKEIFSKNIQS